MENEIENLKTRIAVLETESQAIAKLHHALSNLYAKLALVLVIVFLVQTAGIIYWAASMGATTSHLETTVRGDHETLKGVTDKLTRVQTIQAELLEFYDAYIKQERRVRPSDGTFPNAEERKH